MEVLKILCETTTNNDTLSLSITISVTILTALITIITLFNGIYNAISIKKINESAKQLKKAKENYDTSNKDYNEFRSKFDYLLFKTNNLNEQTIKLIENSENYKTQNNCGLFYLNLSRSQDISKLQKKEYLNKAKLHLNKALELCNHTEIDKEIIFVNLADLYDDLNKSSVAKMYCKKALFRNDKCSQAYNMLASILIKQNKNLKARKYANKAIKYNNKNGYSYLTLAETYFKDFNIEKYSKVVFKNIKLALKYGCPVWEFYNEKIYKEIKNHKDFWKRCSDEIEKSKMIFEIANAKFVCENDYML